MAICNVDVFSSRMCEIGTKGCVIEHGPRDLYFAAKLAKLETENAKLREELNYEKQKYKELAEKAWESHYKYTIVGLASVLLLHNSGKTLASMNE